VNPLIGQQLSELYRAAANNNGQGKPMFRTEPFIPVSTRFGQFPECEVLLNHDDCEAFFQNVRHLEGTLDTDLQLFQKALAHLKKEGVRAFSFNIDLITALHSDFAARACLIAIQEGFIEKSRIVLEITEHTAIPEGADLEVLAEMKKMGFKVALDDFDPFDPDMVERFGRLAPYADIIKFDHSVGERFSQGEAELVLQTIRHYRAVYPDKVMVIEGVSEQAMANKSSYVYAMRDAGIDVAQIYTPKVSQERSYQAMVGSKPESSTAQQVWTPACA